MYTDRPVIPFSLDSESRLGRRLFGQKTASPVVRAIWICLWIGLVCVLGIALSGGLVLAQAAETKPQDQWFKQKLSVLSEDHFRTGQKYSSGRPSAIGKQDCEFARQVIANYSRPDDGLVFEAQCVKMADVGEYLLKTEVHIRRGRSKVGGFKKLQSSVSYRSEASARFASELLKRLNFHRCNVLIDVAQLGRDVRLETVALIGKPGPSRARAKIKMRQS